MNNVKLYTNATYFEETVQDRHVGVVPILLTLDYHVLQLEGGQARLCF